MAIKTVSNAGGVWNVTTTWTDNIVPVVGDTVVFTATSGNLTVNVATANLAGIDFTNYVGTITFTAAINTSGTVNLGTGGYTQAGASGLTIVNTSNITSNGTVWSRLLTLAGGTVTLLDEIYVTDLITQTAAVTLAGSFNLNVSGNLTINAVTSGRTINLINGNTQTWTSTNWLYSNLTINKTVGSTLNINGIVYYGTGTLLYTAGTVNATNATLWISSTSCTLSTGGANILWNKIVMYNTLTITLASALNATTVNINRNADSGTSAADITFVGNNYTFTISTLNIGNSSSGASIYCPTSISIPTTNVNTLVLYMNGYSQWLNYFSQLATYPFTINGGVMTVNNSFIAYGYRASNAAKPGTVYGGPYSNIFGNAEIIFKNLTTFEFNGGPVGNAGGLLEYWFYPKVTFDNSSTVTLTYPSSFVYAIYFTSTTVKSINTGLISSTVSFYLNACSIQLSSFNFNNFLYTNGTTTLLAENTIPKLSTYGVTTFTGAYNLNVTNTLNIAHTTTGNSTIIFNGSGNKTWTSTAYLSTNLIIDAGSTNTLTLSSNIYYQTGTLSYTTGIVDTTTNLSTFNIGGTSNLSTNGITWFNISNANAGNINLLNNLSFTGTWSATSGLITYTGSGVLSPASTSRINFSGSSAVTAPDSVVGFTFSSINITTSGITTLRGNLLTSGLLTLGGAGNINRAVGLTGSITTTGGLSMAGNCSGTAFISLNGGTWSATGANYLNNNLVLNGNSGVSGNVYYQGGTMSYTSGNITTTNSTLNFGTSCIVNTGAMTWSSVSIIGSTPTITLTSGLNLTNNLTVSASSGTSNINGLFNVNVGGNLTITTACSGTSNILINGTGSQTWSSSAYLTNNLNINKSSGTLTLGANIYYNTGTLTYTAGTVNTSTNSTTLNINGNCTLTTNGINWVNILIVSSAAITLGSNLKALTSFTTNTGITSNIIPGIYSVDFSTANVNIGTANSTNSSFTYNGTINCVNFQMVAGNSYTATLNGTTFNVTGNFTLTTYGGSGGSTGTSVFNLIGTGTVQQTNSGIYSVPVTNNLTINSPSGIITFASGTTFFYQTGILTYTAGTVVTTNATLGILGSCILDTDRGTSKINWTNITSFATSTITLSSNLNTTNLTVTSGSLSFTLGGNNLLISGNLTVNSLCSFNTPQNIQVVNLILGNGLSSGVSLVGLFNISVSGNLTQNNTNQSVTGTSTIVLNGTGTWSNASTGALQNNLTINSPSGTITMGANVYYSTGTLTYIQGNVNTSGSTLIIPTTATLNTSNLVWSNITTQLQNTTLTLLSDLYVSNTLNVTGNGSLTISGSYIIYISGNFTNSQQTSILGSASVVFNGTGTWINANTGFLSLNTTINTSGVLTISGVVYYATGTINYLRGRVITKGSTLNLTGASTLLNCNKINFDRVVITSGNTITMNEFFSGSPQLKVNVLPSSTTNYTINFTDRFEKISKHVKLTNCTISNRNQLLMLTNIPDKRTNIGIRYFNNSPNGIAENKPSVNAQPMLSPFLISDPSMNLS